MHIRRKTLRKRTGASAATAASTADIWLSRAASLSQPLLLALAVFGYFYTVVPVYQKELLSEQIAAKEIELGRLQREIEAIAPTMQRLQSERIALEKQVRLLSTEKASAERSVAELRLRQTILEGRGRDLEESHIRLAGDLAEAEARAYHDSFSASVMIQYLMDSSDAYKLVESPSSEAISRFLLTPYAAVSATLSNGDSKYLKSAAKISRQVKDAYHTKVRAALEVRKNTLSRPHDDINALLLTIEREMAQSAVDPTPSDRFNELRFEAQASLVRMLNDSRRREWDRTQTFMDSLIPGKKATPDAKEKF